MKNTLTAAFLLFTIFKIAAQTSYHYTIDLINVVDDKIKVTLNCPTIKEDAAIFVMPRVIPGSYSWKEYGRFLDNVKAFDGNGKSIKISSRKNIFYIDKDASKLTRIEYWVNDSWDDHNLKDFIFQPGGSNIEKEKNFVLNNFVYAGYFEGYKNLPFEIEVLKPQFMYGSTWLKKEMVSTEKDVLKADNYDELADNPVMYCRPDTASFLIDNTRIYISSYSTLKEFYADRIADWLTPLATSLKNFLGRLPVSEYHFLFYFATSDQVKESKGPGLSSGYGALEHNHCSFYLLQDGANEDKIKETVQEFCAHEFLHILTPLNVHSKEIENFNFMEPKMSQHLWMYEGVTEYFSWLVRVQNGLITEEAFIKEIKSKLNLADEFASFSFTEMSKNVLLSENQEKYLDVYQKGAVIAMLFDQLLLKKSGGKYGLKHLMLDLMKKYGHHKAFEDDKLFDDIVALTYPEVEDFIEYYIKGSMDLPIYDYMQWFGYDYEFHQKVKSYFIGSFSFRMNKNDQMEVGEVHQNMIGLKPGDIIMEVEGVEINSRTLEEVSDRYFRYNPYPSELTLKLMRNGKEVIRTGKPMEGSASKKHTFTKLKHESKEDLILFNAWLKGNYGK